MLRQSIACGTRSKTHCCVVPHRHPDRVRRGQNQRNYVVPDDGGAALDPGQMQSEADLPSGLSG
jgi:hypothetical protein